MSVFFTRRGPAPVIAKRLGDYAVGESVFLNENGTLVEYIVVNQGIPSNSSLYDSSCNDTWLLRKDIVNLSLWAAKSNGGYYSTSKVHTYLNDTFIGFFDAEVQNAIKQVKIPYTNFDKTSGTEATTYTGSQGLSTKAFVLTVYELGRTNDEGTVNDQLNDVNAFVEGAKLSYFSSGYYAYNERTAYYNGTLTAYWLRTPSSNAVSWYVAAGGTLWRAQNYSFNYGIRPAIIMPFETRFDPNTNQFLKA